MLAEVLNFQGAKPILGMGSLSYIDKSKLSVIKLDKLDSFIDSVVPKTNCEEEDKDFSKVIIDVSEFF